jgi:hypothetical protein
VTLVLFLACSIPDYAPCEQAEDCVDLVPQDAEGVCLDKSGEGFCTWSCEADEDCEAPDGRSRVCASFESSEGMHCFPSCEDTGEAACPEGFSCRSTGGGDDNRKVCFPE